MKGESSVLVLFAGSQIGHIERKQIMISVQANPNTQPVVSTGPCSVVYFPIHSYAGWSKQSANGLGRQVDEEKEDDAYDHVV